jgi:uncharacterized membrane-anchored protein
MEAHESPHIWTNVSRVLLFWAAFILTRPLPPHRTNRRGQRFGDDDLRLRQVDAL